MRSKLFFYHTPHCKSLLHCAWKAVASFEEEMLDWGRLRWLCAKSCGFEYRIIFLKLKMAMRLLWEFSTSVNHGIRMIFIPTFLLTIHWKPSSITKFPTNIPIRSWSIGWSNNYCSTAMLSLVTTSILIRYASTWAGQSRNSFRIGFFEIIRHHTGAKILNLSKKSHFENLTFDKIHKFKVSFLTRFTTSKSQFWQNSHFQSLTFHKIHIFQNITFHAFHKIHNFKIFIFH